MNIKINLIISILFVSSSLSSLGQTPTAKEIITEADKVMQGWRNVNENCQAHLGKRNKIQKLE